MQQSVETAMLRANIVMKRRHVLVTKTMLLHWTRQDIPQRRGFINETTKFYQNVYISRLH